MTHNGTLTIAEFAKLLKISNLKAYQMVKNNEIGTIRVGRCIRIPVAEYERFTRVVGGGNESQVQTNG